ncbi:PDGLE domain-containing protein [Effusibacillus dendaii]|uniref:PDGLE domain-containing protein n=1 Tax=Effusibacillus dendaii TaxID=2743772 RepID=A0A7I8D731_9BACL|nr:PDGLE domain-containing protein [Effusibacillus dendaii]BCJ85202.1 hypothetical protein skT53_01870 [Effusibacillus dendaii]
MKRVPKKLLIGLLGCLLLAGIVSPFASTSPDGLKRTAIQLGFSDKEAGMSFSSLFSGYHASFVSMPGLSTSLAGIIGVGLTLICSLTWFGYWARRR